MTDHRPAPALADDSGPGEDQQWLWKVNRALARRLRSAHLKEHGVIEDIDYQHPRGLDRKLIRTLASSEWVRQHQNILLIGPTEPETF